MADHQGPTRDLTVQLSHYGFACMGHGLEQSQEELQLHFGPHGPIQPATRFLEAILEARDYRAAWRLMDPDFRRRRAEQWVEANRHHPTLVNQSADGLIDHLAQVDSMSDFWPPFAEIELNTFAEAWSHVDLNSWGWASRPRPIAPDYEVALFLPAGNTVQVVKEATLVRGLPLVMRHTPDGWLLAGQQGDERWAPDVPTSAA